MERDEFIKSLGFGMALVCAGSCFSACGSKGDDPKPGDKPDPDGDNPGGGGGGKTATVNLSSQLQAIGDQIVSNGVLFFRIADGNAASSFVATESVCPHQGGSLVWKQANSKVQCQLHFSEYSANGSVTQQPQAAGGSTRALKIYSTAVTGTTLTATIS
jgi:cytochrome b6-f complex iron-sulfur subunit